MQRKLRRRNPGTNSHPQYPVRDHLNPRERDMNALNKALLPLLILFFSASHARGQSPDTSSYHIASSGIPWQPVDLPAFPEGLEVRSLHANPHNGAGASRLRFPEGYVEPRHFHTTAGHSIYVLNGRIELSGVEAGAGHFFYTPPNVIHELLALEPSEILIWSDGPLDFHLSESGGGG